MYDINVYKICVHTHYISGIYIYIYHMIDVVVSKIIIILFLSFISLF